MLKHFNRYTVSISASATTGTVAQVQCFQDASSVGRIDFIAGVPLSPSYFWNLTTTVIVLKMPIERLSTVLDVLRQEGPLALELHGQPGTSTGGLTDGSYGMIKTVDRELVGEEELSG